MTGTVQRTDHNVSYWQAMRRAFAKTSKYLVSLDKNHPLGRLRATCGNGSLVESGKAQFFIFASVRPLKPPGFRPAGTCPPPAKTDRKYPAHGGRGVTFHPAWASDYATFRDRAYANGYHDDLSLRRIRQRQLRAGELLLECQDRAVPQSPRGRAGAAWCGHGSCRRTRGRSWPWALRFRWRFTGTAAGGTASPSTS